MLTASMDREHALAVLAERWDGKLDADTYFAIATPFGVFPEDEAFWADAGVAKPADDAETQTGAFVFALAVNVLGKERARMIAQNPSCVGLKADVLAALRDEPRYVYEHEDALVCVQAYAGAWSVSRNAEFDDLPAYERVALNAVADFLGHLAMDRLKAGEPRLSDAHVASAFEAAMRDIGISQFDDELSGRWNTSGDDH